MDNTEIKTKYSVQLKYVATFATIIIMLLAFINIYPPMVFRDLVFTAKQDSMQDQAVVMSSSLSPLETLSVDGVNQVMSLIDVMSLDRIIVTDDGGLILYDTSDVESKVGKYALFAEIYRALQGNVVFYSRFDEAAFMSRTSIPVTSEGKLIGSVYLYEYDSNQGIFIVQIQSYLRNISLAVGVFAIALVLIFIRLQTRRITELVSAIRIVGEGDYDFRLRVRGSDELTELADELNKLTSRLRDTEEGRRRFVSDASHELKTPLASIRLLTDSILQSDNMDMETMVDFVSDIGMESERLQRTTERLLELTRLGRDNKIERTMVDVCLVAENTLRLLSPLAKNYDVRLGYDFAKDCNTYASEDDVYQIIFNLVENAIKYNIPGGEVIIALRREDNMVLLTVDDTGIGIPESDLPHIFSRFYRVDKARSSEAGGSGLGLSIVHDAVTLHGGRVEVMPRPDCGTRFAVRFPVYHEGVED